MASPLYKCFEIRAIALQCESHMALVPVNFAHFIAAWFLAEESKGFVRKSVWCFTKWQAESIFRVHGILYE